MGERLAGKIAIVTGAGARGPGVGNGKATAILMAREGARVLCVDAQKDRAEETVGLISAEKGQALAFAADVTHKADCEAMVAEAVGRWGGLDVLHNNVGIESRQTLMDTTEDEWDRVMAVDLKSMLLATQAAVPALERRGGGAVTCVSSVAAVRGAWGTAYAAAKAGILGFVVSVANQLAPKAIRVNAIAPGTVWTPMVDDRAGARHRHQAHLRARDPGRRLSRADHAALAARHPQGARERVAQGAGPGARAAARVPRRDHHVGAVRPPLSRRSRAARGAGGDRGGTTPRRRGTSHPALRLPRPGALPSHASEDLSARLSAWRDASSSPVC